MKKTTAINVLILLSLMAIVLACYKWFDEETLRVFGVQALIM